MEDIDTPNKNASPAADAQQPHVAAASICPAKSRSCDHSAVATASCFTHGGLVNFNVLVFHLLSQINPLKSKVKSEQLENHNIGNTAATRGLRVLWHIGHRQLNCTWVVTFNIGIAENEAIRLERITMKPQRLLIEDNQAIESHIRTLNDFISEAQQDEIVAAPDPRHEVTAGQHGIASFLQLPFQQGRCRIVP